MILALTLCGFLAQSPQQVTVGLHLRNVEAINLEENAYQASFLLWARWKGEGDPTPSLRFTNLFEAWALTLQPVTESPVELPDGSHYRRFVGEGRFFHKFELKAFPLDAQRVLLELEDSAHGEDEVQLVLDDESSVAPELTLPGWEVGTIVRETKAYRYTRGLGAGDEAPHTRIGFGLELQRPKRVFFITMFPPILLVMLCCWFIFYLRPVHVEARIGTVITALLTIVFLQLDFTDDLPYLGSTVLLDQIFNYSYVVISAVLLECVVVMRWFDRAQALEHSLPAMPESERAAVDAERRKARDRADLIDRRSRWAFPIAYAVGCATILLVHLNYF